MCACISCCSDTMKKATSRLACIATPLWMSCMNTERSQVVCAHRHRRRRSDPSSKRRHRDNRRTSGGSRQDDRQAERRSGRRTDRHATGVAAQPDAAHGSLPEVPLSRPDVYSNANAAAVADANGHAPTSESDMPEESASAAVAALEGQPKGEVTVADGVDGKADRSRGVRERRERRAGTSQLLTVKLLQLYTCERACVRVCVCMRLCVCQLRFPSMQVSSSLRCWLMKAF